MTRDEAKTVRRGDLLRPDPRWNQTNTSYGYLPEQVKVIDVARKKRCQTGVLFLVEYINGAPVWLDAGWFVGKVDAA